MKLCLQTSPCRCDFDDGGERKTIIASDGYPLEQIIGQDIVNFFRRILHGDHKEWKICYETRTGIKVPPARPLHYRPPDFHNPKNEIQTFLWDSAIHIPNLST